MNIFGNIFRISIFGESHGPEVGIMLDGCPPGISISEEEITSDLERRKSGAKGTTPRKESDTPEIKSGIFNGFTTGAPIVISTKNSNTISADYELLKNIPRPGHADLTTRNKYSGFNDPRGGGHFSGRLTWGLVVAGTFAKKILAPALIHAELIEAGGSADIESAVEQAIAENDSIGGIIRCTVKNLPGGIGEPFFLSVESAISQIIFSIPAIKGIEFGSGFQSAKMKGSEHNDAILDSKGTTLTNHAGGINGGITNGNELVFQVAVKPTSSISKTQETIDIKENKLTKLNIEGRHDACIALRIPVILEAATAIALADLKLMDRGIFGERKKLMQFD
jgi:chorismate synthase